MRGHGPFRRRRQAGRARWRRISCARRTPSPRSSASTPRPPRNAPGVVAVLTAADLAAAHYHSISHPHPIPGRGGKLAVAPHRPALAEQRVMHVGEPVAMVVAVSAAVAQDAAEKVVVDYEPLTPVTDCTRAISAGRAAALAGCARQYRLRLDRAGRPRRQEAGRARPRLQGGRACGARRTGQPAPGGCLARAAHRDREL